MEELDYQTLVEKHIYYKGHEYFNTLDNLCFLSKNLYNATLYAVRQHYFNTGKYLNYYDVQRKFQEENNVDYRRLPAKVSQQIMKLVNQNFSSFFSLLRLKNEGKFEGKVKIPHYLNKKKGRQVVIYTNQALSTKKKEGYINLSGTDVFIKTDRKDIQFARVVHKGHSIVVEIGYRVEPPKKKIEYLPAKYASIDIGIDNLATVSFTDSKPFIINGRPIKSINQYFNKTNAKLKSQQGDNQKTTNKMKSLYRKRNNKIKDYLHKSSRYIVNQLVSSNITTLVIGHTKNWKQDTNLGKKNNQNFVSIPFNDFIFMLTYKCALEGIDVFVIEESYTSKASFLDRDKIPTYNKKDKKNHSFSGYRKSRGIYRSKTLKREINADVNGSLNILRKFFDKSKISIEFNDSICVLSPKRISVNSPIKCSPKR